jgi:CBS domain-containing protein
MQTGSSPLYLFREIDNQRTIEGLYPFAQRIPRVVRALVEEGARANNITRVITVLNDQIVHRLLTLLDAQMGPAPFPYCWFTFGSEGRKEQTFKTDQDNALIYEPPSEAEDNTKIARIFFRRFGIEANRHLDACGFELCKGKMMVSNPRWRKPYQEWKSYFDQWMALPEPEEVLNASIFFDFRPVFGRMELGDNLKNYLALEAPSREIFLLYLAKDFLVSRPPLTFFKNFMVEKDGKYKNRLDLKTQGMTPFVNFARLWALRRGIKETNTMERIEILAKNGFMPRELYMETRDAYEFQMQLRLVNQLRLMEADRAPDNYIDPADLSQVEKQTLKEAFSVIGRLQEYVKSEFRALE